MGTLNRACGLAATLAATQVDPSTRRTIPVITKPDLIDSGAEKGVLDMLLGRKHTTDLGFHMVKCRGQKALNEGKTMQVSLLMCWMQSHHRSMSACAVPKGERGGMGHARALPVAMVEVCAWQWWVSMGP